MNPSQELEAHIRSLAQILGQKPKETARWIGAEANRRHVRPLIVAREKVATCKRPGTPRAVMNRMRAKGLLTELPHDQHLEAVTRAMNALKRKNSLV